MTKIDIFNWKQIGISAMLLLCPGLTGCGHREADFLLETEHQEEESSHQRELQEEASVTPAPTEPAELYVDVCGAVVHPGVFSLAGGSRVFDAVEAAGGLLPEAAVEYVNRAEFVEDGQQIYIPTQEEARQQDLPSAADLTKPGTTENADARVNINTADAALFMTLPGIGETKAQAILAYREEAGGFAATEELMNVPGIKQGTFDKIKDKIAVE